MGRKIVRFFAALAFLAGLCVFLYPTAEKWMAQYETQKTIEEFQKQINTVSESGETVEIDGTESDRVTVGQTGDEGGAENADVSGGSDASVVVPEENTADTDIAENTDGTDHESVSVSHNSNQLTAERLECVRQDLLAYNERLYQEGQSGLNDPFDYENCEIDLTAYGFSQNVIGSIWIPRMEVELPIYIGANYNNMAKGAALLGQTSMPMGTVNSNVVLAGHRGWSGIPMFRNIQAMQIGDKIQIETPWETLVYRVCELKIISPDDSHEILIQEGRDLVTLLTCHPYTQNTQRYMVIAERSMEEPTTREVDLVEAEETYNEEPRVVEVVEADGTVSEEVVEPGNIKPVSTEGAENGAQYSNLQIWLEDYGVWIAFAMVMFLVFMMLVQSIRSASDRRKKKKEEAYWRERK